MTTRTPIPVLGKGRSLTFPPTPRPEEGQGPWCNNDLSKWWVVADNAAEAFRVIQGCDGIPDGLGGWTATIEPVFLRWVPAEEWNEEHEITELAYDDGQDDTSCGWRITVEGR